MGYLSRRE